MMLLPLTMMVLSPPSVGQRDIVIHTRDLVTIAGQSEIIEGVCDGIPVKAIIRQDSRQRKGYVSLRVGTTALRIPDSFMGGWLTKYPMHLVALACDGKRVVLQAYVARKSDEGIRVWQQSIKSPLRQPRIIDVSELTQLEPGLLPN